MIEKNSIFENEMFPGDDVVPGDETTGGETGGEVNISVAMESVAPMGRVGLPNDISGLPDSSKLILVGEQIPFYDGELAKNLIFGNVGLEDLTSRDVNISVATEEGLLSGETKDIKIPASEWGPTMQTTINAASEATGIPVGVFTRNLGLEGGAKSATTEGVNVMTYNKDDINSMYVSLPDPITATIEAQNANNLIQTSFGEGQEFKVYPSVSRGFSGEQIMSKTSEEMFNDLYTFMPFMPNNQKQEVIDMFLQASDTDKITIYKELFSLESYSETTDMYESLDDFAYPLHSAVVEAGVRFDQQMSTELNTMKGAIEKGLPVNEKSLLYNIYGMYDFEPILPPDQVSQGLDPESAGYPTQPMLIPDQEAGTTPTGQPGQVTKEEVKEMVVRPESAQEQGSGTPSFLPKDLNGYSIDEVEYMKARREFISDFLTPMYGEQWRKAFNNETKTMTALAQLDKDAKASGKTREEVLNEYVGFVLPSIDPEQFGDGKSAIPSFNVPGLKSYSPSREYYLRNLDEGVIQDLRKNMNMYQTLVTSEGGIFRKRDLSTDEAYELAKSTTAGIQGFDINEDGVVEDSEIRVAISSYQDAYVSELNYLKFQIENNTNLAIASVVMTDNVDLVDKGLLVPLEVGGVKYNVTPRQLQMFGYFSQQADNYSKRLLTIGDVPGGNIMTDLMNIRYKDQMALDEWARENPALALFSFAMEGITAGSFGTVGGAMSAMNSGTALLVDVLDFLTLDNIDGLEGLRNSLYADAKGFADLSKREAEATPYQGMGKYMTNYFGQYAALTDKAGNDLGLVVDSRGYLVDAETAAEWRNQFSDEQYKEILSTSEYERSAVGIFTTGLRTGTEIAMAIGIPTATYPIIFSQSYGRTYGELIDMGVTENAAAATAIFTSLLTVGSAKVLGVEGLIKGDNLIAKGVQKVLGQYGDDVIANINRLDAKTIAGISTEIMAHYGISVTAETTQELFDQIQKNFAKFLLTGEGDILVDSEQALDITILSTIFGAGGAKLTQPDRSNVFYDYFVSLAKTPNKLQSLLERGVQEGSITQEQANVAMIDAENVIKSGKGLEFVQTDVRYELILSQMQINNDMAEVAKMEDSELKNEKMAELEQAQENLNERKADALEYNTLREYTFDDPSILPSTISDRATKVNENGSVTVVATLAEIFFNQGNQINLTVKSPRQSDMEIAEGAEAARSYTARSSTGAKIEVEGGNAKVTVQESLRVEGGAIVDVYNKDDKLIFTVKADADGVANIPLETLNDGSYSVRVVGQYDLDLKILEDIAEDVKTDVVPQGKTEAQIASDYQAASNQRAVDMASATGVPVVELTDAEYNTIVPAMMAEQGVDAPTKYKPEETSAMVIGGTIYINENKLPSMPTARLMEEFAHYALTTGNALTGADGNPVSVNFDGLIDILSGDPAFDNIMSPENVQRIQELYDEGNVSSETIAAFLGDLATSFETLSTETKSTVFSKLIKPFRDLVSPNTTTVGVDGSIEIKDDSAIPIRTDEDIKGAIQNIADMISNGGIIPAADFAAETLPTTEGTGPQADASIDNTGRLNNEINQGRINSENIDEIQNALSEDLRDSSDLTTLRENFAADALRDPANVDTYFEAYKESKAGIEAEQDAVATPEERAEASRNADIALANLKDGNVQGAIEAANEALDLNPNSANGQAMLDIGTAAVIRDMQDNGASNSEIAEELSNPKYDRSDVAKRAIDEMSGKASDTTPQDTDQEAMPEQEPQQPEQDPEQFEETPEPAGDVSVLRTRELLAQLNNPEFLDNISNPITKQFLMDVIRDFTNVPNDKLAQMGEQRMAELNGALAQALDGDFHPIYGTHISSMAFISAKQIESVVDNLPKLTADKLLLVRTELATLVSSTTKQIMGANDANQMLDKMRRMRATLIDIAVGNGGKTDFKDAFIQPFITSTSKFLENYYRMRDDAEAAMKPILRRKGAWSLLSSNKEVMSRMRIMLSLLQQEYLANPESKQVATALEYVESTIENFGDNARLNKHDLRLLQKLRDELKTTENRTGVFDTDATFEQQLSEFLNKKEMEAFLGMSEQFNKLGDYHDFISTVIEGEAPGGFVSYVHHSALINPKPELSNDASGRMQEIYNNSAPKQAKAEMERTEGTPSLIFDPLYSFGVASKELAAYAFMHSAVERNNQIQNQFNKDGYGTDGIIRSVKQYMNSYVNTVLNKVSAADMTTGPLSNLKAIAYRGALTNVNRGADFVGNAALGLIYADVALSGARHHAVIRSSNGMSMENVLLNIQSGMMERLLGRTSTGTTRGQYGNKLSNDILNAQSGYRNIMETILKIGTSPLRIGSDVIGKVADRIITAPEDSMKYSLYLGSFAKEFKKLTGESPDFARISANDTEYMTEYASAIEQSRLAADEFGTAFMTNITSMADLRLRTSAIDETLKNGGPLAQAYAKMADSEAFRGIMYVFSSFQMNDADTQRKALSDMVRDGKVSPFDAARLYAAVHGRQIAYYSSIPFFQSMLRDLYDDEDRIPSRDEVLGIGPGGGDRYWWRSGDLDVYYDEAKNGLERGLFSSLGIFDANGLTAQFGSLAYEKTMGWMGFGDVETGLEYTDRLGYANQILRSMMFDGAGNEFKNTGDFFTSAVSLMSGPYGYFTNMMTQGIDAYYHIKEIGKNRDVSDAQQNRDLEMYTRQLNQATAFFSGGIVEYDTPEGGYKAEFSFGNPFDISNGYIGFPGGITLFNTNQRQYFRDLTSQEFYEQYDYQQDFVSNLYRFQNTLNDEPVISYREQIKRDYADESQAMGKTTITRGYLVDDNIDYRYTSEIKLDPEVYDEEAAIAFAEREGAVWNAESYSLYTKSKAQSKELRDAIKNNYVQELPPPKTKGAHWYDIVEGRWSGQNGVAVQRNLAFNENKSNIVNADGSTREGVYYREYIQPFADVAYTHFAPAQTYIVNGPHGGVPEDSKGNPILTQRSSYAATVPVYFTYEQLNALKLEEWNFYNELDGRYTMTVGEVKSLWTDSKVLNSVNKQKPVSDYGSSLLNYSDEHFNTALEDLGNTSLAMPALLQNKADNETLTMDEVKSLTPYGYMLHDYADTESAEVRADGELSLEMYEFLYGDPDRGEDFWKSPHSNLTELGTFSGEWNELVPPVAPYVGQHSIGNTLD